MKEKATIKDIAKAAGVSIGTVDRVLHNRGEVAEKTKTKILQLAEQMNYKPNILARALTSRHSYDIVALLPSANEENIYWENHRSGILYQAQQLERYSLNVTIINFELHDETDFRAKANEVLQKNPDGVIFAPILKKESIEFSKELDANNIPYIFIDTYIENTNCLNFIGEDAFQSGRIAASVIDFGLSPEKDILMVNLAKDIENTQHLTTRNQGFLSYFMDGGRNTGMKISLEIPSTNSDIVKEKLDKVLTSNPNIGAIWISSAKAYIIARYLEKINRHDIILVGYEVYDTNIEYLCRKIIKYLIAQQPKAQGSQAIRTIFAYLAEHIQPLKIEYQKTEIVNSENVRFFIDKI